MGLCGNPTRALQGIVDNAVWLPPAGGCSCLSVRTKRSLLCSQVKSSVDGRMPVLTEHLWLGKGDAEAAAVSLKPKLKTSLSEVSRLLAEAVSLEVPP